MKMKRSGMTFTMGHTATGIIYLTWGACPVVAVQMAMGMRFHPKHCRMKSLQG